METRALRDATSTHLLLFCLVSRAIVPPSSTLVARWLLESSNTSWLLAASSSASIFSSIARTNLIVGPVSGLNRAASCMRGVRA